MSTEAVPQAEPAATEIENVLGALLNSARLESSASFQKAMEHPQVAEAVLAAFKGDCDGFYFALQYPLSQVMQGLANYVVPGSDKAQFLLGHVSFVESQFRAVIEKYEGTACGADKTGFLLDSLLEFFKSGQPVVLDRTQKYTYHLPAKVFLTHDAILAFFDAVYSLYYGRSAPFVEALAGLEASVVR